MKNEIDVVIIAVKLAKDVVVGDVICGDDYNREVVAIHAVDDSLRFEFDRGRDTFFFPTDLVDMNIEDDE